LVCDDGQIEVRERFGRSFGTRTEGPYRVLRYPLLQYGAHDLPMRRSHVNVVQPHQVNLICVSLVSVR